MGFNKKTIIFLMGTFVLGALLSGFYFGNKKQCENETANSENNIACPIVAANPAVKNSVAANNIKTAKLKLDLLKSYTNFVLLPPEEIANAESYANDVSKKLEAVNDPEITSKFEDTLVGEETARNQKIIDFLNFLNEEINADLQ